MKIIAGQFRGRNFYTPKDIRPTQAIVRKAVFDLLGQDVEKAAFLDLFAGSGAMGLEALSRGASEAVFVEKNPRYAEIIRENIEILNDPFKGRGGRAEVVSEDAFAAVKRFARQGKKFDIIFADAPYGAGLAKKILKTLNAHDIVKPVFKVVLEHEGREILPESEGRFLLLERRKYSSAAVSIYSHKSQ